MTVKREVIDSFDIDKLVDAEEKKPFVFTVKGKRFTLKHFEDLDKKVFFRYGKTELDMMKMALESGMGEEQYKVFDAMPLPFKYVNAIFTQWAKTVNAEVGKS